MNAAKPFLFAELAKDSEEGRQTDIRKHEKDRRYSADDLAKAVEEAKRDTAADVEIKLHAAMANDIEQRRCDMLGAIKDQLVLKGEAFDRALGDVARVSKQLALAMATAVVPRAIERQPFADISDVLKAAVDRLATVPSIELHLPPDLADSGTALLRDLGAQAGFKGEITSISDSTLAAGDAKLSWKGGTVERYLERLEAEAHDIVDRWLPDSPTVNLEEDSVPPKASGGVPDDMKKNPEGTTNSYERAQT